VQNPIGLPPKGSVQNNGRADRYKQSEEDKESIVDDNDIDFDMIEDEIDNKK
jgi:hypothetical protein